MRITLTRIVMAAVAVAALSAFGSSPAHAGDDLSRETGVVSDSVMVTGRYEATGYAGGFFNRQRITVSDAFIGSAQISPGERGVGLVQEHSCAGDLFFVLDATVHERREDGSVLVSLLANTWDECPRDVGNDGWSQEYAWVAPGESVEVNLFARSSDGAVTATATFLNIWTPKIDTSSIQQSRFALRNRLGLRAGNERFTISAVASETPRIHSTTRIDVSKLTPAVAPVPVPEPVVIEDSDSNETSGQGELDLTDLIDDAFVTVTIPNANPFTFQIDF